MAPVGGGRPFLEYILLWLRNAGIMDLVLCVGNKRVQIQSWLGDGSQQGVRIRYSAEKELRGTAGALKLAAKFVRTQTCLVLNADSFLELDLREMYRFHRSKQAMATIALARVPDPDRYGTVELDPDGKIVAFHEKSDGAAKRPPRRRSSHLINGGVYLLQRQLLNSIPSREPVSLEKKIFPELAGGNLYGFVASGFFIDIGVPADYLKAQAEFARRFTA
jgi:NDP-sugar pyrophosphorylase family protein